jgi:hypothetical protein
MTKPALWIPFAESAARHGHCVKTEERDMERYPELRDAMIYVNGRRYMILKKLEAYERKRAQAPFPPKRAALRTKRNAPREAASQEQA